MHQPTLKQRPAGFTLIELLVVTTLLLVLIALTVTMWPRFNEREKARKGGDMISGWLLTAKQTAKRDNFPRGLRLEINPANGFVTTAYYTERLPDFKAGQITFVPETPGINATAPINNTVFFGPGSGGQVADLTGGIGGVGVNNPLWPIQPGDMLEIVVDSGILTGSPPPAAAPPSAVTLSYTIGSVTVAPGGQFVTLNTNGLAAGPPFFLQPMPGVNTLARALRGNAPYAPKALAAPGDTMLQVNDITNMRIGMRLIVEQNFAGLPMNIPAVSPPFVEEVVQITGIYPDVVPVESISGRISIRGLNPGIVPPNIDNGFLYAHPQFPAAPPFTPPRPFFTLRSYRYPVQTENYRIVRRARPLTGEQALELPQNVVIDMGRSVIPGYVAGSNEYDLLFSPSGSVLFSGGTASKVVLWMRDASLDIAAPGDQILIGVYARTGQITSHRGDLANPALSLTYFQDGRSSGM